MSLDNKRDDICPDCDSNEYVTTLYHPPSEHIDCPMRFCHKCWVKFKHKEQTNGR